jgi:integrase
VKLNKTTIRSLALPDGKCDHIFFDDALPGFGVRLRAGGSRRYVLQYDIGGKTRKMSLGSPAELDPGKARETARDLLASIRLGGDPAGERSEARARVAETVGAELPRYLAQKAVRSSTRRELERYLLRYARPLHNRAVAAVSRRDVASLLQEVASANGGASANKLRKALSALYAWLISEGLAETNPVAGTNRAPENGPRERVLDDHEIRLVWQHAGSDQYGAIIRLLMLTGSRREEIGDLRWSEIDFEQATILLPSWRTKSDRPHLIPLSGPVLAILRSRPRVGSDGQPSTFVFGTAERGFQDWSGSKRDLDARLTAANGAPLPGWRVHDLRRTLSTKAHDDLDIAPHIVEAILAHKGGHKRGVAGVYNWAEYRKQKREALDAWADFLVKVGSGQGDTPPAHPQTQHGDLGMAA